MDSNEIKDFQQIIEKINDNLEIYNSQMETIGDMCNILVNIYKSK